MRIITRDEIIDNVAKLCVTANTYLTSDVCNALENAYNAETDDLPKSVLNTLLDNLEIAKQENMAICQDTGMAVVFLEIGQDVHISGDITEAVNEGVRQGYKAGYFRNSIVSDPINRVNTNDNTPAVIHFNLVPGSNIKITVAPKGFGSENMSQIKMLNPSDGIDGVIDFVTECVRQAGASPCPPIVVGVGIGGTMEKAAILAKQALLLDLDDSLWSETEALLLEKINALNIGPAGFGGKTTALGVKILTYPTHIAGLPVAVNINCHVARHQSVII